jgi:hypothetical protein
MTTLAADKARTFELGDINEFPVIASEIIYEGAVVGDNASGYARPLVAGDHFLGFAERMAENATIVAGSVNVRVKARGLIMLNISALAITDVGKDVYASDDDTFTLTKSTNTRIGYVYRWVSTGYGIIAFESVNGTEAELTDSTGGSPSDTIANTTGVDIAASTGTQVVTVAEFEAAVASLAAKINYLLRKLGS